MKSLTLSILVLFSSAVFAEPFCTPKKPQSTVSFDLDLGNPITANTYTVLNNDNVKVRILNMVPSMHYTIAYAFSVTLQQPPLPGMTPEEFHESTDPCIKLEDQLHSADNEINFGLLMLQAKATSGCQPIYRKYFKASTLDLQPFTLSNQTLVLTIVNTDSKATWTFTFRTKETGIFLTTYGFTYIPYLFSKSHTYYAKQNTVTTTTTQSGTVTTTPSYTITSYSWDSETHAEFAPTILFHYLDYKDTKWSTAWTAGLGVNFNSDINNGLAPLVFAGWSALYHENIGITVGFAGHAVNQIKGNYAPKAVITTNLQTSDLIQRVIGVNPFISITFRFSSNPFAKGSNTTPTVQPGSVSGP